MKSPACTNKITNKSNYPRTRGRESFTRGAQFANGASVRQAEVESTASLSTSAFLADCFEEECRANFEVTFSARPSQVGLLTTLSRF